MANEFEYYDNTHMKTKEKCGCIICSKPTDRLDVLAECYICSKDCDKVFNSKICDYESR